MSPLIADLLTLTPFVLLLAAVLALWAPHRPWAWLLGAAVAAAYVTGAVRDAAALWIGLFVGLALLYQRAMRASGTPHAGLKRMTAGLLFAAFAVVMGLALLPGFPRTVVLEGVRLSPGGIRYSLSLAFPKVIGGILILGLLHPERVRSWRELGRVLLRAAPVFLCTALGVMLCALALGYVRFDPKWTPLFFVWAVASLFFTCMAEEAFFRGFLLRELAQVGGNRKISAGVALAVSSLAFGLVHLAGGWKFAIAATLAGGGYGWAYLRTQRVEASMAVHFGLNATHFLLFTYPALG